MNIILTGISTDQREFLDEMESEYCKFKGLEELPDNVYQAFYWLSRYSNLAARKINTNEEKLKSPNTGKAEICSDNMCDYCVSKVNDMPCGPCKFVGRKLQTVS